MNVMPRCALYGSAIVAVSLLLIAGCGGDGRESLQGDVTVDVQPVESGYIQFRPAQAGNNSATGANVTAGKFNIDAKRGLLPGTYRVEITASRKTNQKVLDDVNGGMTDAMEQYIPEKYNSKSTLTAEVKAGGPNQFEFKISLK